MAKKMDTTGGTSNKLYLKQIKNIAAQNRTALSGIGITVKSDGTLSVNQKTMKAADTTKLKNVFGTKDCFASAVTAKSEKVETDAAARLAALSKNYSANYNKYGYLNSSQSSSGNLFNSKG